MQTPRLTQEHIKVKLARVEHRLQEANNQKRVTHLKGVPSLSLEKVQDRRSRLASQ